jgi:hypothetical protein
MIASDVIVVYLANLMWNEPKEDNFLGMTACGLVVRNRILAGWDGADWIASIRNFDKYSANPPVSPRVLEFGDPIRDDRFRRCLAIATNIYSGFEKDITYGALRYCRLDQCSEDFKNRIVRPKDSISGLQVHPRVAQIGLQSFFK